MKINNVKTIKIEIIEELILGILEFSLCSIMWAAQPFGTYNNKDIPFSHCFKNLMYFITQYKIKLSNSRSITL